MSISKTWAIGALIVGSFITIGIFGAISAIASRLMFGHKGKLALLPADEINAKLRRARSVSYLAFAVWLLASVVSVLTLEPTDKVFWAIGAAAVAILAVIYGLLDPRESRDE